MLNGWARWVCVWCIGLTAAPPESASWHNARGVEHYSAKRWEDAIGCFLQAYELEPTNPTVRRNLCNAYQSAADAAAKGGDLPQAVSLLEAAITADPKNPSPLVQLGAYYLRLDRLVEAAGRLQEALDLDPENPDALDLLGDAYYRSNDLPSALAQWERAKQVAPARLGLAEKLEKAAREESVESKFGRHGSRHFDISFAPGTSGVEVNRLLTILEQAYREVGRKFGCVFPPHRIPVIVYTAEDFAKATLLGEHVGAIYDGKIRVPYKDSTGQVLDEKELRRRLFHEYVHVVVRYLVGDHVPWWLNEGLAETFSNGGTHGSARTLQTAMGTGGLFQLSELEEPQLDKLPPERLRVAYAQAHVAVEHLWNRFGQRSLVAMMTALAEGTPAETALIRSYRRSYSMLERETANAIAP